MPPNYQPNVASTDPAQQPLCERCRQFDTDAFFPDPLGYHDYDDGPLEFRRTWDKGISISDSSKAFWLGTVGEVKGRVETESCELCEFVLDSLCAFWHQRTYGDVESRDLIDRTPSETILKVKELSNNKLLCIFRWRRVAIRTTKISEPMQQDTMQWRDRAGHVFVGAASKEDACSILEWDLEEKFGRVVYSTDLTDALKIEHLRPLTYDPPLAMKEPRGGPLLSMKWAITALDTCKTDSSHSYCRKPYTTLGTDQAKPNLAKTTRFVDLHRKRVVQGLGPVAYATLSYVWGHPRFQTHCLKKSDCFTQDDGEQSASHQLPERLPSTIEDAMTAAKSLSLDYLWVDSLCIVQDSDEDKAIQMQNMAAIYANAVICIVDAAGNSANSGLSGVSVRRSRSIANLSPTSEIKRNGWSVRAASKRSPWLKRAWTFQERILSPRCLIFYKDEACFVCGIDRPESEVSTHAAGDVSDMSSNRNRDWPHLNTAKDIESHSPVLASRQSYGPPDYFKVLAMYHQSVSNYNGRELTYEVDVLNAFSGLGAMFARATASAMRFGVPERALHRSLLWRPEAGSIRYRELLVDLSAKDEGVYDPQIQKLGSRGSIPSWSWASWRGRVSFPAPYNSTILGTQIVILKPTLMYNMRLDQVIINDVNLKITTSSLLTLTKIAWLSLEAVEGDSLSIKSFNLVNPQTGTTQFAMPGELIRSRIKPERLCTIEEGDFEPKATISAAFIQLGALQQTGSSWKNERSIRHGYEDECYILRVDVEPLLFHKVAENPYTEDVLRTVMKTPGARRAFCSEEASYVDPIRGGFNLPKGKTHGHKDLLIDVDSSVVYDEKAVFVARRRGIAHIPESAWRAAKPKDAIVFLT